MTGVCVKEECRMVQDTTKLVVGDTERCVGCQSCMFACARRLGEAGLAKTCIGVRSAGGMERGFIVVVCRACDDPSCAKACPYGALKPQPGGGVKLDMSRCMGCDHCRKACMIGAIYWDDEGNKPMICSHCGYCGKYCPHGLLKLGIKGDAYAER
jgi:Fe-S-cluster-containing dehydrogenase component